MKRLLKMLIASSMLLSDLVAAYGQPSTVVSGRVTDSEGEPLIGVGIEFVGTKVGAVTDLDGYFSIKVTGNDPVLEFSYVGLQTTQVKVSGRKDISVTMFQDKKFLDEVVVIGYGEVKKSDLTGSVSTINKREMSDRVTTSLEDAMRGKAAGVLISQNDGVPGSDFSIRIRGASSINASSTPIFVVDGIICENADDISVGDVESIEIMKDASSTAIYGSRGANGVIIITTKKGQDGNAKVNFTATTGVQTAVRPYKMMDSEQYALSRFQSQWQYKSYSQAQSIAGWLGDAAYDYYRDSASPEANYWRISKNASYKDYADYASRDSVNTNWQAEMFRPAILQNYNLTVSGGTNNSKYSAMVGYLNQEGIVVFSGFEKFTGRLNYETSLSEIIKLYTNLSLSKSIYDGIATGTSTGVTTQMLRQPPIKSIDDTDLSMDDDAEISISSNPYYQAEHITKDKEAYTMSLRAVMDYKINTNWLVRVTGTYAHSASNGYTYYPKTVTQGVKQKGRAIWELSQTEKIMNEDLVYYTKRVDRNHILKLMGGFTYEKYGNSYLNVENQNFEKEDLGANNIGQGTNPIVPKSSRDNSPYQMMAFLGRAEYNLMERYLFTATMRADGSSRFGANHKWGHFPSAAFAWKMDQEKFIKDIKAIDLMKLRLSAGSSGNTAIPAFRTLSTMATAFVPMDGKTVEYGLKVERPDNQDLKWETTAQYDAGLDLSLWNGLLSLTVDAYRKVTSDLLLESNAPYYSGYKKAWTNLGSIQNQGIEFTLGSRIVERRNFYLDAMFNIAFNKSKVLDIPGGIMYFEATNVLSGAGNFVVVKEGEPLGQWYGYKVDGVYTSQGEIDALPDDFACFSIKKADLRPGDHRFVNRDENPSITTDDRMVLGNGEPKFSGGFSFSTGYKGWGLTSSFQYSYGADVFNVNLATLDAGREMYNQTVHLCSCYSPSLYAEDGTLFFQGNQEGLYRLPGGTAENYCLSEFIEDGSYLRLSDITVSYTFGRKFLRRAKIDALKLYLTGKNLYVWTNYFGYDPEVNTKQGNLGDFMPSLDFGSYPRSRTVSFGVNVTF